MVLLFLISSINQEDTLLNLDRNSLLLSCIEATIFSDDTYL